MTDALRTWLETHPRARWFYPIWFLITGAAFVVPLITGGSFLLGYACIFVLIAFVFRRSSVLLIPTLEGTSAGKRLLTLLVVGITVAGCVLPMNQYPLWNGEIPGHRNQYELMAENILAGRVSFDYGDEADLLELENPYDPAAREESGVRYHWDHAFYDGKYYMYFGVVPVFLAFLPYRIITGEALTTYHATQLFTALTVVGIFALFALLAKRFFKRLPYCVYLALSVAFSAISVWYAAAEPALYCTAITAALALEIWSLYFFMRAVHVEKRENRQILLAGIGALLGALTFGCRPTIALGNILVLPMLAVFLKPRQFSLKLLGKLFLAALPYAAVAVGLMLYNYARFDDPFEFGQKYQLTVADQTQYSVTLNTASVLRVINEGLENFFKIGKLQEAFPYIKTSSVFYNFPVLLLIFGVFKLPVLKNMRFDKVLPLLIGLMFTVLVITAMDILWTPYLLERYRMDIYFLLGIGCFLVIGFWYNTCTARQQRFFAAGLMTLCVVTLISVFLLSVQTVGNYYSGEIGAIAQSLRLP